MLGPRDAPAPPAPKAGTCAIFMKTYENLSALQRSIPSKKRMLRRWCDRADGGQCPHDWLLRSLLRPKECLLHLHQGCPQHSLEVNCSLFFTWGICARRAGKLYKARSRLYRSQILQVNTRRKALAEIYTMHSFAPFWNRIPKNEENRGAPFSNIKFFVKTAECFSDF